MCVYIGWRRNPDVYIKMFFDCKYNILLTIQA